MSDSKRRPSRVFLSQGAPAVVALAAYVGWFLISLGVGHNIRDFANVGSRAGASNAVSVIHADARYSYSDSGYDGQYFLAIARAPTRATPYLDYPQYRYSRVIYPLTARALALGRQGAIPYMLVVVNVLAIALTTLAVSRWLVQRGSSPWASLFYAFLPGAFVTVQRDLSETLAYSLAAWALVSFDHRRVRMMAVSAALFGLAVLTRESAAVLAIGCVAVIVCKRDGVFGSLGERLFAAGVFVAAIAAPYLAYRIFLSTRVPPGNGYVSPKLTLLPFEAIARNWNHADVAYVYGIIIPSVIAGAAAAYALVRRQWDSSTIGLLAAVLAFVVFAPGFAYDDPAGSLRSIVAVGLASVFAVPVLERALGRRWPLFTVVAVLGLSPWWELLPFALKRSWA